MLDGRSPMVMQLFVVVRRNVAARKDFFEVLEELGIDGHYVFKVTVFGAILHHQDLAVALDDLRLDLANLFIEQHFVRQLPVEDLLADLRHAARAQRVRRARPAQRWLLLLIGLEQRLIGPLGSERRARVDSVQSLKDEPGAIGGDCDGFLNIFDRLVHPVFLLVGIRKAAL